MALTRCRQEQPGDIVETMRLFLSASDDTEGGYSWWVQPDAATTQSANGGGGGAETPDQTPVSDGTSVSQRFEMDDQSLRRMKCRSMKWVSGRDDQRLERRQHRAERYGPLGLGFAAGSSSASQRQPNANLAVSAATTLSLRPRPSPVLRQGKRCFSHIRLISSQSLPHGRRASSCSALAWALVRLPFPTPVGPAIGPGTRLAASAPRRQSSCSSWSRLPMLLRSEHLLPLLRIAVLCLCCVCGSDLANGGAWS